MGYLKWWDHNKKKNSKRISTIGSETLVTIATASKDDANSKTSAMVAADVNGGKVLSSSISNSAWIIDSGASDHMNFDYRHVSTIKPCSVVGFVRWVMNHA